MTCSKSHSYYATEPRWEARSACCPGPGATLPPDRLVVLQRDPAAPHLPGALSPRVLFDLLLRFFGSPEMGQVALDRRTPPVACLSSGWLPGPRRHPAASFGRSDGGGAPPPTGAASSFPLPWSGWLRRAMRPPQVDLCPKPTFLCRRVSQGLGRLPAACPVPLACLCSSFMATCPSSRT